MSDLSVAEPRKLAALQSDETDQITIRYTPSKHGASFAAWYDVVKFLRASHWQHLHVSVVHGSQLWAHCALT